MARGNARRSRGTNNLNSVEFQEKFSLQMTPSLSEDIDGQCGISDGTLMPPQVRQVLPFLLKNCHRRTDDFTGVTFHDLARFWSDPTMCEYTRGEMAGETADASWVIAMKYLTLGKFHEAKTLALNGCFVYECKNTPIETLAEMCGENFSSRVGSFNMPRLVRGCCAIHTPQHLEQFLQNRLQDKYRGPMSCSDWLCSKDKNMGYVESISDNWKSCSASNHPKPSSGAPVGARIQLVLVDGTNDGRRHSLDVWSSTALKVVFNDYADRRGVSLRSLRFSHRGNTLFLSGVGNKTPDELNMSDQDVINVINISAPAQESSGGSSNQTKKKKKAKSKNGSGSKGRRKSKVPIPQEEPDETLEKLKARHSKVLGNLHEELYPRLKEIRNRLDALGLERQPPKLKKKNKRKKKTTERADNCILSIPGTGGKAGKPFFIIQVGEVDNLYKTKKSCHLGQSDTSATLDLHRYSKNEALNTLDKTLPKWVDTAMNGEYPWVITVRIICGCGSQVLSEAVQEWIKSTRNVRNASKNCIR